MNLHSIVFATALTLMQGMPFDDAHAVHHFTLAENGGAIQVDVRNAGDTATLEMVRMHLQMIADDFKKGDFGAPFATHHEVPPGVPAMQKLKDAITYTFEQTGRGGRVRISTKDPDAVNAIHEFLRYQIKEHHTADPTDIK